MRKTILITGTSSGFGNDTARTLAAAGHRVVATLRDVKGRGASVARELEAQGVEVFELDVTKTPSVDAALAAIFARVGGKLDVVVNNAGLASAGISESFTPEQLAAMLDVNVVGVHRVLRAVLPEMRKNGAGLVINVGSILGRMTIPFLGLYGASKHALEAMTESYRYELSQLGIDVVLVQPGPYPTRLYNAMQQPADATRAAGYGELAAIPGKISEALGTIFAGANAPDPHDVATTVLGLVDMAAGQRPARVVVGGAFGADAANVALAPLQSQMVHGFGLQALETLKTS